jgi:hypothetical protein
MQEAPSMFNRLGSRIILSDGIWPGYCRRKVWGRQRTDLSEWPDGSLRWRPYDARTAKAKRNITEERAVRRKMRSWVR